MGCLNERCPCCGSKVDTEAFVVDLNTNTIFFRGKSERVRPQAAEVLFILGRKCPATVKTGDLAHELFGGRDIHNPEKIVHVLMTHARHIGRLMNFGVENIKGRGYRLVLPIAA